MDLGKLVHLIEYKHRNWWINESLQEFEANITRIAQLSYPGISVIFGNKTNYETETLKKFLGS